MTSHRRHELAVVVARCRGLITTAGGLDPHQRALAATAVAALADLHDALDPAAGAAGQSSPAHTRPQPKGRKTCPRIH